MIYHAFFYLKNTIAQQAKGIKKQALIFQRWQIHFITGIVQKRLRWRLDLYAFI